MNKVDMPTDVLNTNPTIDPSVFIARGAQIIGDVRLAEGSSIWYNAVLRGDINSIRIGKRTNLQDGTIVHVDYEINDVVVGDEVTIGHRAVIHGCWIHSRCLIGMNATVLSGAEIQTGAIVAAGAVVRENQVIPQRTLFAGVPAAPVRDVTDEEWETIVNSAAHYVHYGKKYLNEN